MTQPVVTSILRRKKEASVTIADSTPGVRRALRTLGVRRGLIGRSTFTVPSNDDEALATVVEALATRGAWFLDLPHGWPPAAVAQHLREVTGRTFPITTVTRTRGNEHTTIA